MYYYHGHANPNLDIGQSGELIQCLNQVVEVKTKFLRAESSIRRVILSWWSKWSHMRWCDPLLIEDFGQYPPPLLHQDIKSHTILLRNQNWVQLHWVLNILSSLLWCYYCQCWITVEMEVWITLVLNRIRFYEGLVQVSQWICPDFNQRALLAQSGILGYRSFFLGYWDIAPLKLGYWDIH